MFGVGTQPVSAFVALGEPLLTVVFSGTCEFLISGALKCRLRASSGLMGRFAFDHSYAKP